MVHFRDLKVYHHGFENYMTPNESTIQFEEDEEQFKQDEENGVVQDNEAIDWIKLSVNPPLDKNEQSDADSKNETAVTGSIEIETQMEIETVRKEEVVHDNLNFVSLDHLVAATKSESEEVDMNESKDNENDDRNDKFILHINPMIKEVYSFIQQEINDDNNAISAIMNAMEDTTQVIQQKPRSRKRKQDEKESLPIEAGETIKKQKIWPDTIDFDSLHDIQVEFHQ